MNSAGGFGASLWSGYDLPACHPKTASPQPQPAEIHLSTAETCPDKTGQLSSPHKGILGKQGLLVFFRAD